MNSNRPKLLAKDVDSEIIDAYIGRRKLRADDAQGLRRTLTDFKDLSKGKLLSHAKRSDAVALVEWLQEVRGLKPGRVKKLVAYLKAAINYEMVEHDVPRIEKNVFVNLPIRDEDQDGEIKRASLDEGEIKHLRENLDCFPPEQRLMLVWHCASSIRPGGLYSATPDQNGREWEDGEDPETGEPHRTRYVRIRKDKGLYGRRCLPVPQAVLDLQLLPNKLIVPLFTTPLPQLLVMINRRMVKLGIDKSLYHGRHRAKDRMMVRGVEEDMRKAIMGHARRLEAHDLYGTGFPMWKIKPAIDKIGF